jgi:hypothetical protein
VAAIRSALERILKPTGKDATAKEILKLHGYTLSFAAPTGGHLSLDWTTTIRHRKSTLARGSLILQSASTARFTISLTSQGRADLKRYPDLDVSASAGFLTSGMGRVNASAGFTLAGL